MIAIGCDHGGYELKLEIIRNRARISGFRLRWRGGRLSNLWEKSRTSCCGRPMRERHSHMRNRSWNLHRGK